MQKYHLYRYFHLCTDYIYYTGKSIYHCGFLGYNIAFAAAACCENTKERSIIEMIQNIIEWITNFSWTIESTLVSAILLGEYPYPSKEDYPD